MTASDSMTADEADATVEETGLSQEPPLVDAPPKHGSLDSHVRWGMVAVFVAVALLHMPPVDNSLHNDDGFNYVLEAELLLEGSGSAWVKDGAYLIHQNLQRLVGSLSFVPRYGLFDLWMPAWHLPSIALHALNAALLVLLLIKLGLRLEVGVLSGLLFGFSPLHPHVVSWIGGTFDLFAGAFMLGALIAFIDHRKRMALICVAGAFCSKENGAFIGPVLAFYVLCFERRLGLRAAYKRLAPFAFLEIGLTALRGLQIWAAGSLANAGVLGRSVDPDPIALFTVAPGALVSAMANTAFGGRRLGEAADALEAMVRDPSCFRVVTISGAMTIAKQGLVLCEMIERGWVQAVVVAGAVVRGVAFLRSRIGHL